ncbi:hypothetical protein [Botryobacter ruber]|uniref:hypothetical protein n=1 Tax=Botryobacter ruber TaxID=2171629 RepID=UPI000F651ADF|nr:hypothetical protein [Botryobacter ruber]
MRKFKKTLEQKEELIPALAKDAFQEAYKKAIASGETVTVVRGTTIVEVNAKGVIKVVGYVKPGKKVTPGRSGFRIR